jgi:hypothetical protein
MPNGSVLAEHVNLIHVLAAARSEVAAYRLVEEFR